MQFCPKCKNLLIPKKDGKNLILKCSCGYIKKNANESESKKFSEKIAAPKKIEVIDSEKNPMPKIDWNCKKCGAKEAYFWSIQLRRSDEAETTFYRCVGCGKTWRRSG
jgi:DNA-directed RNA polymerase subunit M